MNLFKALRLGNGKTTFYEQRNVAYWFIDTGGKLMYNFEGKISPAVEEVCENKDWIPYVPVKESPKKQVEILTIYYEAFSKYNLAGLSPEEINKILIKPYGLPWKTSRDILLGKLPGTSEDLFKNYP